MPDPTPTFPLPEAPAVRKGLATWAGYLGAVLGVAGGVADSAWFQGLPEGVQLALVLGGFALAGIVTGGRQLQAFGNRNAQALVLAAQATTPTLPQLVQPAQPRVLATSAAISSEPADVPAEPDPGDLDQGDAGPRTEG